MKRGCFINCICLSEEGIKSSGVMKKVYSQIGVLRQNFEVDHVLINTYGNRQTLKNKIQRRLPYFPVDYRWKYSNSFAGYDFVYFRKSDIDYTVYKLFLDIKRNNPSCKIILEIPTYPYEKENFHGIKDLPLRLKDKINRNKFKRCIDRIVTYTADQFIFDVKTIPIYNGIDFSQVVPKIEREVKRDAIEIIAVASFSECHGYDRILEGLGEYYKNYGKRNILLHLVGGGSCIEQYKSIVNRYDLYKHVIFHGWKSGKELDEIYNTADIALDVLAGYRKDYYLSSSLKSRECAAKGLPIVSSCKIDYLSEGDPFVLYVPNDSSPIDMRSVVDFFDRVYCDSSNGQVIHSIRSFAYENCDMQFTMQPVVDYILSEGNNHT